MTLAQIPEFGFFVLNSRIGVKIQPSKLKLLFKILNTEKVDLQVLMFKPCLELPPIDNAKWECTQYNLLYSQCKIKCNSGFKFIGDANARKICELYEDTKASDTKARFQIAITV